MIPYVIKRNLSVKISDIEYGEKNTKRWQHEMELVKYVTGLKITNNMPGGFGSCTISMVNDAGFDWDYMRPGNDVRILDGAFVLFEGRVEDPGTVVAMSGAGFDIVCAGHIAKLKDDETYRAVFIDSSLQNWQTKQLEKDSFEDLDNVTTHANRFDVIHIEDDDETTADRLVLRTVAGQTYQKGSSCRHYYWLFSGAQGRNNPDNFKEVTEKIRRITCKASYHIPDGWRAELITKNSPLSTAKQIGVIKSFSGTKENVDVDVALDGNPKAATCVIMRLVCLRKDVTNPDTGDDIYFKITNIAIYGTDNVKTDEIDVGTIIRSVVTPLYQNVIDDDTKNSDFSGRSTSSSLWGESILLENCAFQDPTDRGTVIEAVNAAMMWDYAVWEWETFCYSNPMRTGNRNGDNLYVSSYSDPSATWSVSLSYSEFVSEVLVRYYKSSGEVAEVIIPSIDSKGNQDDTPSMVAPVSNITKRKVLEVPGNGQITKAFARKVGEHYYGEHKSPIITGTVSVSAPLVTQAGTYVEPWRIRSGQYIKNTNILDTYNGLPGEVVQGISICKIVAVDIDMSNGTATLEVGRKNPSRIDMLFARMDVQRRKRWMKYRM